MRLQWAALVSFVLVTTFTPGPNNVSSMSQGVSHGYKNSLRFLYGIACGFVIVMGVCAIVATLLLSAFPFIEPYMRIIGSLYIVWLAIHTFIDSLRVDRSAAKGLGFLDGLLLQILNVKVIIYGLTLYSTFLGPASGNVLFIAVSAIAFAAVGFAAISTWNLMGTTFSRVFQKTVLRRMLSAALSLLLLYSAAESSGLILLLSKELHHTTPG